MKHTLSLVLSTIALLLSPMVILGQAPDLGTSNNFALFTAAGQFENVGAATVVVGDVGTNGGAFLAFPPGTLVGNIHVADPVTVQAKIDVDDAYADLAGRTCGFMLINPTLGNGQILAPNTYCIGEATTLNGNLTLDAQGDPDAIFIFQIGGAFATSTMANVLLVNGANLCNVFWQIDGAFTLGGGSLFVGTVIANGAINLHTGSTLNGRALSTAGAISTSDNFVTRSLCQAPTIICAAEVVVSCDNLVPAPDITSVSVTTTCPGAYTVTFQSDVISNQSCPNQYTLTRTYLVTDACGETATCEQTILVDDQILPGFTACPVAPIALGCNPPPTAAQAIAAAGQATDNCGVPVVTAIGGVISGNGCVQSQTWTVTATDDCNNMATCLVTFTWNSDTQNPAFSNCPVGPVLLGCNPALPTAASAIAAAGAATDDCGVPAISAVGGIITGGCVQSQTWTVTATDICNNTATCLVTFTWSLDTQDPVFTNCPTGPVILGCTPNPPTAANAITAAGPATDNCGVPAISAIGGVVTGGCIKSQTWTVTATDICNNTATCLVTITWSDSDAAPPSFLNCPVGPINLGCDPILPTEASAIIAAGPATDDCGTPILSAVGGIITGGCVKSQIWTVTATDICNTVATCLVTFTWTSDTQPLIVDIPDYTLPGCTNPAWPASLTTTWTDNCGGGGNIVAVAGAITSNGCSQSRVYTFTVVGVCGAPDVETTIVTRTYDVTKPVFTSIPPNVTVQCDAVPPQSVAPIATDNCDATVTVTLLETRVNGNCPDTYTLTRRWTAMDDCGNTRTASQRITVRDTQKPVFISVPGNITIQCSDPIPAMVMPIATDNCDASVTVTYVGQWFMNTTCPGNYQIMRSWSAVDNCGNSTVAAQIISIVDNTAPTFTNVPQSMTIECNQSVPPLTNPTATDNCGGYVQITYLGQVRTNGSCLYNFTLTRTWRARDLCGNSTTAVQVITVQDTQPPVFINPPMDITVECECYCVPFPIAIAQDNCGPATVTYLGEVQSPGDCSTGFTLTRTWIASDLCGNTSIHTQVIHLCDVLPLLPPASEEREDVVLNEKPRDFQLRPNPANDRLQIDLSQFVGEAVHIMIFSELGALVWEQQLKPAQEDLLEINLRRQAGIKDGVYQVMLQSGGQRYVKSLVLMQ